MKRKQSPGSKNDRVDAQRPRDTLVRERERQEALEQAKRINKRRFAKKRSITLSANGHPPRTGFLGPEEFYLILKDLETVRRDRIKSTLSLAEKRVRLLLLGRKQDTPHPERAGLYVIQWEDWAWAAATSARFRSLMRNGGLSATLSHLLKAEEQGLHSSSASVSLEVGSPLPPTLPSSSSSSSSSSIAALVEISITLGEPSPPQSKAQVALDAIWRAILRAEEAESRKVSGGVTVVQSSKKSMRAIPISNATWIKHFVCPESRLNLGDGDGRETQSSGVAPELEGCLEALPSGLQLARRAPSAHKRALSAFKTELRGHLLPGELLAFGETQSSGPGLALLKKELANIDEITRTRQMALVRQLFDAIDPAHSKKAAAAYRKNKKKNAHMLAVGEGANRRLAKSNLLRAISYRKDVRALLKHAHAPPGLTLALTEPRKFRRLLQRALDIRPRALTTTTTTMLSDDESPSSPSSSSSSSSSPSPGMTIKRKKSAMLISQQELLAIATCIEREEIDAPKRAMKRYIGDVFRQVFDLVADDAGTLGVSTHDLALALRHKREVIELLEGKRRAISSDASLVNPETQVDLAKLPISVKTLPRNRHELEELRWTETEGLVTVQELLRFCGIVASTSND